MKTKNLKRKPEPSIGGSLKPVGSEKKCELGECWRPAEYVDKFGILMCAECMEAVRAYTCGIVPLSPNSMIRPNSPAQSGSDTL